MVPFVWRIFTIQDLVADISIRPFASPFPWPLHVSISIDYSQTKVYTYIVSHILQTTWTILLHKGKLSLYINLWSITSLHYNALSWSCRTCTSAASHINTILLHHQLWRIVTYAIVPTKFFIIFHHNLSRWVWLICVLPSPPIHTIVVPCTMMVESLMLYLETGSMIDLSMPHPLFSGPTHQYYKITMSYDDETQIREDKVNSLSGSWQLIDVIM